MNRITFVSPEGDLFTIEPDGSSPRRLTGSTQTQARSTGPFLAQTVDFNNYFAWPTWAPDGAKLAASRVRIDGNRDTDISIQVIDATTARSRTVFNNDVAGLVADRSPHYLYWSPDSRFLAFLAAIPQGLTLFVVDTQDPGGAVAVETNAPLYFHWAGNGDSLLLHAGRDLKVADKPFGSPRTLLASSSGFRVPAFSPDGSRMAYVTSGATSGATSGLAQDSLFIAETGNPDTAVPVLDVGALVSFMWSPDGTELAVADQRSGGSPIFDRLRVVSSGEASGGASDRTIVEEPLIAFYWSPDGERIAWVSLDAEARVFKWNVAPKLGSPAQALLSFQPSADVLTMLSFFDQYAYSHSPWSPDSSRLVVAGSLRQPESRRNGQTPTGERIFVLDATGATPPQEIAAGTLAFWSWN